MKLTISPTKDLSCTSQGQWMSVRSFRRWYFTDASLHVKHEFLRHQLVCGVTQAKSSITSFATGTDVALFVNHKGAELTSFNLEQKSHIMRKSVFGDVRPGKTQTSLLIYRSRHGSLNLAYGVYNEYV